MLGKAKDGLTLCTLVPAKNIHLKTHDRPRSHWRYFPSFSSEFRTRFLLPDCKIDVAERSGGCRGSLLRPHNFSSSCGLPSDPILFNCNLPFCIIVTTTTIMPSQKTNAKFLKHKRRICQVEGCTRIVKSQGRCQRHGAKPKSCRVEGCCKQAQGNFDGMCSTYHTYIDALHWMIVVGLLCVVVSG